MATKYTHEQAVEAAARFASLYNVHTNVVDTDFEEGSSIANYSFFGVRFEQYGPCIHTIDSEEKIANLRKLAYIITQTDQDLSQEDPNLDPTYANRMLMQASDIRDNNGVLPSGDIPVREVGQYY